MGLSLLLRSLLLLVFLCCVLGWTVPVGHTNPNSCFGTAASHFPEMGMLATVISRDAPAPLGPDPYKLVYDDLEGIKGGLKKVLTSKGKGTGGALSSNEVLSMAAREFMERKGKSFRPMLVLLIGRHDPLRPLSALFTPWYPAAVY